jgi:DUF4097 and DUF4098 domain-containing protein YvlB
MTWLRNFLSTSLTLKSILTGSLFLLFACARGAPEIPIPEQRYLLPENQSLMVDLPDVELVIQGHVEPNIWLTGTTVSEDPALRFQSDEAGNRTSLTSTQTRLPNTRLVLSIPNGTTIEIQQRSGAITIRDFSGHLSIETTSAPIQIDGFQGQAHALTRRGWIEISASQGQIDALAEADDIRFSQVRGALTGTNIMGDITFEGVVGSGDSVRLETDHGGVMVALDRDSSTELLLQSAGGRIVCTLPGLSGASSSCRGSFGAGAGTLWIRTVSGPIRIESLDLPG